MKGLVFVKQGVTEWRDIPEPVIKSPYDAIVRPAAVLPCTSDVHAIATGTLKGQIGQVLGHEAVGIVEEVGSEVKNFRPGDRVILPTEPSIWRTREAQQGMAKMRLSNELGMYGYFAEYASVFDADMNMAKIPDSISWEQAAVLPDVVATAFTTVEETEIEFGDTVVVMGVGPIGLMAVKGAELQGAGRIIAVGSRPKTLELAKELGASDVVDYKKGSILEQVFALTGGKPVDRVLIAAGGSASDAFGTALTMVRFGGIVTCLAGFLEDETVTLPNAAWFYGSTDKTIKTVRAKGGCVYLERLLSMVENGRFDPSVVISHQFYGLEKISDALEIMTNRDNSVIKPIVFTSEEFK